MKKLVVVVLVIVVILILPLLGGSMIWMLGGADGLDIEGTSRMTDRPVASITAGDGWEKLCPFLEIETPDVDFPWAHKTLSQEKLGRIS